MEILTLSIPGKPIHKNRPRFARRGKFVKTYSDQVSESGRVILYMQNKVEKLIDYPIHINFRFYFERAKADYGTGRNAGILKKSAPVYYTKKPDVDNLIKFYLDCMNDVILKDDRFVVSVIATKAYCLEGMPHHTRVEIFKES